MLFFQHSFSMRHSKSNPADGPPYVYHPTVSPKAAQHSALRQLVETFFGGSTRGAMAALLDDDAADLSQEERLRLRALIEAAAREGR
jgi:predicted transcriptional regulator